MSGILLADAPATGSQPPSAPPSPPAVSLPRRDARWVLGGRTTTCFVAGIVLLIGVSVVAYRAVNSFAATAARVAQTHQVKAAVGQLQRALIDVMTARRQYITSFEPQHLETVREGIGRAAENLGTIKRLTADNPRQHENTSELDAILSGPLARAAEISANPVLPPPSSSTTAANPRSHAATEELLGLLERITAEEDAELQGRRARADRDLYLAVTVVPIGACSSVVLLSLALFLLNREAGNRKRAQASLVDSERRYRLLFDSNPLPMWVFDLETLRFTAVNATTLSFYGYTREEFLSMSIKDIRPTEEVEPLLKIVATTPEKANFKAPRIWRHRKKDGTIVLMEVTTDDLEFDGRRSRLVLANDVSARVEAEESVRQLNAELETRVRQRTAQLEGALKELESFSYSVSHDLRAPLRHVQGYVSMLEREMQGKLSEKAQRHLRTINNASMQMGQLIDDLLDFSRMGRVAMQEAHVALDDLLQESMRELEMVTQGRRITWKVAPLPVVVGDPAMLRQVLSNLLGNAVKYTRQRDPAAIEIGCAGQEDDRAILFVRDNGAGFDMQYADKLFGVFQRLHRADEFEGTGIGLATVRRVVSRHGGRVWAEAALGRGATFYFTMRRAAAAAAKTELS